METMPGGNKPLQVFTENDLVRDRFFRRRDRAPGVHGWRVMSHDGTGPVFADVSFPGAEGVARASPPIMLLDRVGHDGPWAVLDDGRILDGTGNVFPQRFTKLPVPWKFVAVSSAPLPTVEIIRGDKRSAEVIK